MAGSPTPEFLARMRAVAEALDDTFNGTDCEKRTVGFALFTFEFDRENATDVNFISNADRADFIAAIKGWLARAEGQPHISGRA